MYSKAPTASNCNIDDSDSDDDGDDDGTDLPLAVLKLSSEIFDCDFKEMASLDSNLVTCNTAEINWDFPIKE